MEKILLLGNQDDHKWLKSWSSSIKINIIIPLLRLFKFKLVWAVTIFKKKYMGNSILRINFFLNNNRIYIKHFKWSTISVIFLWKLYLKQEISGLHIFSSFYASLLKKKWIYLQKSALLKISILMYFLIEL